MVFEKLRIATSVRGRRGITGWLVGGVLALLLIAFLAVPFLLYGIPARPFGFFPFFFLPFGFIFFFVFVFFAIRVLVWGWGWGWRGGWSRGYWRSGGYYWGDATEVLRLRYAKGEITKEQFDQMMSDLKAQRD